MTLQDRLRSIRGSFVIPVESPNIFAWAEEAADALDSLEKQLAMKQDDWLEACKEVDAKDAEIAELIKDNAWATREIQKKNAEIERLRTKVARIEPDLVEQEFQIAEMQLVIDAARNLLARLSVTKSWMELRSRDCVIRLADSIDTYDKGRDDG